jgi:recombination protein RecA
LGVEFEIIKKAGSWFSYESNKLGQGRDAVKTLLLDNPELMDELEKKIKEKAGLSGQALKVEIGGDE